MLRIQIDGAWEPNDFIEVLYSMESMYYKLSFRRIGRFERFPYYFDELLFLDRLPSAGITFQNVLDITNRHLLERARFESPSYERLKVRRINYGSPGGIDLLGAGKVFEVIANSIGRMVTYYGERHVRRERDEQASLQTEGKRIELEQERENLRALKIRNAKEALELLYDHPDHHEALLPLLVRDQDALSERIAERKLIGANISRGDPERE